MTMISKRPDPEAAWRAATLRNLKYERELTDLAGQLDRMAARLRALLAEPRAEA